MSLFTKSAPKFESIVAYAKSSQDQQFDRDLVVLDNVLAQYQNPFSIVIDRDGNSDKLADIIGEGILKRVETIIVPDFSHLGFAKNDWPSISGDLFALAGSDVHLISVRDGYDSKKDNIRDAIAIAFEYMKSQEAA